MESSVGEADCENVVAVSSTEDKVGDETTGDGIVVSAGGGATGGAAVAVMD